MSYQPITWRNVNAPSNAAANDLLVSAGDSLEKMFSGLGQTVKGVQNDRATEYKHNVDQNTQAYLNAVKSYSDLDQLKAAQPDLAAMLQGYNGVIDSSKTRGAVDAQTQALQNRFLSDDAFSQAVLKQSERSDVGTVQNLIAKNDFAGARNFLKESGLSQDTRAKLNDRIFDAENELRDLTIKQGAQDFQIATNRALSQNVNTYQQLAEESAANITKGLKELGVDSLKDVPPEKMEAVNELLAANRLVSPEQHFRNGISELSRLDSSAYATPGWQTEMWNIFDQQLAGTQQLSTTTQNNINQELAKLNEAYGRDIETNVFNKASEKYTGNDIDNVAKWAQDNKEKLAEHWKGSEQAAIRTAMDAVTNGMEIDVDGTTYKVTPPLLDIAIQYTDAGVIWDDDFKKTLETVLANANISKQLETYKKYTDQVNKIKNAHKGNAFKDDPAQKLKNMFSNFYGRQAELEAEKAAAEKAKTAKKQTEEKPVVPQFQPIIEENPLPMSDWRQRELLREQFSPENIFTPTRRRF